MATHSALFVIVVLGQFFIALFSLDLVECGKDETKQLTFRETILAPWMDSYGSEPNITFRVCYRHDRCVEDNDIYTIDETLERPFVSMTGDGVEEEAGYLFCMVDVDSFNHDKPLVKPELHWLVHSISGNIFPYQDMAISGKILVPYMRPSKSYFYKGVYGIHRMYMLLFKQGKPKQDITYKGDLKRFSLRNFTRDYDLGYPMGGCAFGVNFTSKGGFEDISNHL